jgi:tetratricopeptide (TPR) repeat protein
LIKVKESGQKKSNSKVTKKVAKKVTKKVAKSEAAPSKISAPPTMANEGFSGPVADILRETEVGLLILNHRNLVLSLVVIVVVALLGYGANSYMQQQREQDLASASYSFSQGALLELTNKKVTPQEFVSQFNSLDAGLRSSITFTPTLINSVKELVKQQDLKAALAILEPQSSRSHAPRNYGDYLVARWLVTIYEDMGEGQKAVDLLEELNSAPFKVLEARNYLDLGRIYIALDNYEKASLNLDYVIQNFPNDPLGKMARIYLEQINK